MNVMIGNKIKKMIDTNKNRLTIIYVKNNNLTVSSFKKEKSTHAEIWVEICLTSHKVHEIHASWESKHSFLARSLLVSVLTPSSCYASNFIFLLFASLVVFFLTCDLIFTVLLLLKLLFVLLYSVMAMARTACLLAGYA